MKLVHTSDWHLGHQLYGFDRTAEQEAMLNRMVSIVNYELPDVFLLCGDVFHVSQPSATIQRMFVDALERIRKANPEMRIIITAGNHDSGMRHEIFSTPWSALGVDMVGVLHQQNPEDHIFEISGKGFVVAMPYVSERFMPEGFISEQLEKVAQRNVNNLPIVLTAHTTVRGADFTGHDTTGDFTVGGIEGVDISRFGEGYDYLALGHIHHPQFIHTGRHNVRYSGSPLAVSFDENYPHSVSIVELGPRGSRPEVRIVEIANHMPLFTLPASGFTDLESAKELLKGFPDDAEGYVRLNVESEGYLPTGAADEAAMIARDKRVRFCGINLRRINAAADEDNAGGLTVSEFKRVEPIEIARRYIEGRGFTFGEDIEAMFNEVLRVLEDEKI